MVKIEDYAKKFERGIDMKNWISVGMFLLAIFGSVASYFKSMSDIRQEISRSIYEQAVSIRREMKSEFASKEEAKYIQLSLAEIKAQLASINQKLDR